MSAVGDVAGVEVRDRPDRSRYEVSVGGELAGVATYRLDEGRTEITLIHTEVDPAFRGRSLADRLARHALDDARERGLQVRPDCPFMRRFIKAHPEYGDLVADWGRFRAR